MGVSDKMARRYALSLEQKGYLVRVARRSKTNLYDLRRLFVALEKQLAAFSQSANPKGRDVLASTSRIGASKHKSHITPELSQLPWVFMVKGIASVSFR